MQGQMFKTLKDISHISAQTEEDKPTKSNKRKHSTMKNIKTHKQVGPFHNSQLTPIEEVPE